MKICKQAVVEVDTEFYKGKLPVVCMDRCLYDLIIGNDVYKHGAATYDVEQTKTEEGNEMIDIIFENSKFDQSNAHLENERSFNKEQMDRRRSAE